MIRQTVLGGEGEKRRTDVIGKSMWSGIWKSWGEADMMLMIRDRHVPTTSRWSSNSGWLQL